MADNPTNKSESAGFLSGMKTLFSAVKKYASPFLRKLRQIIAAGLKKVSPLFKKLLGIVFLLIKKLWACFSGLNGYVKLIVSGATVIVLAGIIFGLSFIVPRDNEIDAPIVLEADYSDEEDAEEALETEEPLTAATPAPTPSPAPFTESLSKGADAPLVATVQARLMGLGYMDDDEPTEHFGNLTRDALTVFQKHHNLPADGILQEATYATLFSPTAQAYVLQIGDTGDDVAEVQDRLYELGYLSHDSITGTFGEKTQTAVMDFQRSNKLKDDGQVGAATLETLYSDDVVGNFFKKGETSETVKSYQQRLIDLGYLSSGFKITGKMDNQTIAAIKAFQEKNDLVADGCLGPTTMSKLDSSSSVSYALQVGMKGSKVKDLQTRLYKLGYLSKSQITGYYGEDTEEAVKAFQRRNGLKDDGQVGSKTLEKLNSSSAVKAKVKTPTPKPTKKTTKKTAKPTKSSSKAKATAKSKTKVTATPKKTAKATATPKPSASKADQIVTVAKTKLGCPYVRGKKGPDSFDCSGFVYWCLKQVGVSQSYMTSIGWRKVSKYTRFTSLSQVKKGDVLVFSGSSDSTGHVGLAISGSSMIDASSGAGQVRTTSLSGNYWKIHFICGYHIWG